jgi:methionyl-tRNA synthetase
LHEYLDEFKDKQDVLRYVLTANMPETKDNDFTWKDFQARNNNELVAVLGNFINRAVVLTNKYFDGAVPSPGELTEEDKQTLNEISAIKENLEKSMETYRFREALKYFMDLARLGNKYLADTEPWKLIKTDEERVKTILNVSLQITANLAVMSEPFLPFTSKKIYDFLNLEKVAWDNIGSDNLLNEDHKINKPVLLFEKVEDKEIEAQLEKLEKTKQANQVINVEPQKEVITFDDFTKMDIRIGTILEAEKVPKTKKLLKLKINTGIDERTVVSGIAEYFEPEKIIGKQVSILVNLAPRKIKGIESQGMILMAENSNGELVFVSPGEKTNEGAMIS